MPDYANIAATVGLGVAGLYFGQSLRRKTRAEIEAHVAERRFESYSALWEATLVAAPSGGAALTADARQALHAAFTEWYFTGGHGMVLSEDTRNIYLTAKNNLTCELDALEPAVLRERLEAAPPEELYRLLPALLNDVGINGNAAYIIFGAALIHALMTAPAGLAGQLSDAAIAIVRRFTRGRA